MNYTNEFLEKLKKKAKLKDRYGNYFYRMSMAYGYDDMNIMSEKYLKKCNRIKNCLNIWVWDKYEKNKLLDLQMLNRCNMRNCPVCKTWDIAKAIHNFKPGFNEMQKENDAYLVTLTVPNVRGEELKETIEKMFKSFTKMINWLNQPIGKGLKGFKDRMFKVSAGVRVLEVTVEKTRKNYYHPHLHCIFFIPRMEEGEHNEKFDKYIQGAYQRKTNKILYYSNADIFIMRLWKFAYDNIKLTSKNFLNTDLVDDIWYNLYQCDIREMDDPKGVYEVLKYTYKDSDIKTYEIFKTLYLALESKRIRQTFGELYNIDLEKECGEKLSLEDFLEIEKNELPEQITTKEIHELTTTYHEYKKISRFKSYEEIENID